MLDIMSDDVDKRIKDRYKLDLRKTINKKFKGDLEKSRNFFLKMLNQQEHDYFGEL